MIVEICVMLNANQLIKIFVILPIKMHVEATKVVYGITNYVNLNVSIVVKSKVINVSILKVLGIGLNKELVLLLLPFPMLPKKLLMLHLLSLCKDS